MPSCKSACPSRSTRNGRPLSRSVSVSAPRSAADPARRATPAADADATTVGVNDGTAAGQEVPHAHVHIVPRFEGDGGGPIHAAAGDRPDLSDGELDDIAAEIGGE